MAQVPYQPFANVDPMQQGRGPREIGVNTPSAAFGENIAEAVKGLGGTIERSGNELYQRAIALQELKNETEAKDADINFMSAAGEVHAKFNALEGRARVDAYPQYQQQLKDLYQQHRSGLSNDMARRMFDSSAVSTLSRTIFNGAGAAATAQKEWGLSSIKAEHDMLIKQVFTSPTDEGGFNDAMSRVPKMARDMATLMPGGYSPEREADLRMNMESALIKNKIEGIARAAPLRARELYEQNADKMTEPDRRAVESSVTTSARIEGSDKLGTAIIDKYRQPDGTYSKSAKAMEDEVRAEAEKLYKFDPLAGTHAVNSFKALYQQRTWADQADRRDVQKQVATQLLNGATTLDQFPPELLGRMTDSMKLEAKAAIIRYQHSERVEQNDSAYHKLLGLYNNDRQAFMDVNPFTVEGLSKSNINFFNRLQREQSKDEDPRVKRAIGWLQGARASELQALQLFSRDKANPDDFDRFTGAMHEAIQAYQDTYGKPPGQKEVVDEIFPTVTRMKVQQDFGYFHPFTTERPVYQAIVPEKARAAIDRDFKEQNKLAPTEDDYVREFERMQFLHYFEDQRATKPKSQSRVK